MSFQLDEQPDQASHKDTRAKSHKYARPNPPTFTDVKEEAAYRKTRLILACRILADEGMGRCSSFLSIRDAARTDSIWIIPAGTALAVVSVDDLIQLDLSGNVLSSGERGSNYDIADVALHLAIYASRPDAKAVIHSHATHMRAFSMLNKSVSMVCQDACTFHKSLALVPLSATLHAEAEPQVLLAALGGANAAIMQQRGGLVVNPSIEGCVGLLMRLEGVCQAQLLAEGAAKGRGGQVVLIGEEEAEFTAKSLSTPHHCWLLARPYFMRHEKRLQSAGMAY